jgi:hypothetical protein
MDTKALVELLVAVCTALMAVFTLLLALETRKLEKSWRETSREQINTWRETSSKQIDAWFKTSSEQIGVEAWLALEARFDSQRMKRSRRALAEQLERYNPSNHDAITEEVMEHFESIGAIHKRGLLDKELAYSSFSFHAVHWWEASKDYIYEERKRKRDKTLFADFEEFAKLMRERDSISGVAATDLKAFLQDEKNLRVVYSS